MFGLQIIFLFKNYYFVITEEDVLITNLVVWTAIVALMALVSFICYVVKPIRHEFKHSRGLVKKWTFNFLEVMFIPIMLNLIPFSACTMSTESTGYTVHKCEKTSNLKYVLWGYSVFVTLLGFGYVFMQAYMITYRKVSFK